MLIGLYIIQVYKGLIHTHRGTNVCNLVFGSVIATDGKPFDNFVIGEKLIPQQFPIFPEILNQRVSKGIPRRRIFQFSASASNIAIRSF